jgi:hypothetical protein
LATFTIARKKKEDTMREETRVLARAQARILTDREKEIVAGGIGTKTVCTIGPGHSKDGDVSLGEC